METREPELLKRTMAAAALRKSNSKRELDRILFFIFPTLVAARWIFDPH
jgi:hypothetical protein